MKATMKRHKSGEDDTGNSSKTTPIYLDYLATTPVGEAAKARLISILQHDVLSPNSLFGNASSNYVFGHATHEVICEARRAFVKILNCDDESEIIFNSGSTESITHAIFGSVKGLIAKGRTHFITSSVEHPAVANCFAELLKAYPVCTLSIVSVDENGNVPPSEVQNLIQKGRTGFVSVMLANNEFGTVNDLKAIASVVKSIDPEILIHTDASQALLKIPVDVKDLNVDLLSFTGHKFYAPKGVGGLFVKRGVRVDNILFGGGQELGKRPGTENVLLITAMHAAAEDGFNCLREAMEKVETYKNEFLKRLDQSGIPYKLNGNTKLMSIPGMLSISFFKSDLYGFEIVEACAHHQVCISAGAACHAKDKYDRQSAKPSKILLAMKGMNYDDALRTVRISFGRLTTLSHVHEAATILIKILSESRQ